MSAILKQIQEDDGEAGARVRKNVQRAKDASPDRLSGIFRAGDEVLVTVEKDSKASGWWSSRSKNDGKGEN